MLRDMKEIEGYTIQATDGEIGSVYAFYFDEESGYVRYLVADTGGWLPGRKVLIATEALGTPNWATNMLPVNLSKQQVEDSPIIDTEQPVSRQMETHLRDYYGWSPYWQMTVAYNPWQSMGPLVPSPGPTPDQTAEKAAEAAPTAVLNDADPHLRSSREVIGYHIQATDGEIAHVETFLVDDATWRIHYLVIDTRNWLPGKKVLIAPEWIGRIDWADRVVHVNLAKAQIKSSPEYDKSAPISRSYEENLYTHYNSTGYWHS